MSLSAMTDRPGRLTDAVHSRLRAAVLAGDPAPGEQLSVPKLARLLDVSRGSVREAVLQLVADGLAEERPRRGVVVVSLGLAETRYLHQVREVLEGLAAGLCASTASESLVAELGAALDAQAEAIGASDGGGYADTDTRFHSLIAQACGNPMLERLIERLHDQMQVALVQLAESPVHRGHGHEELRAVVAAIRNQDPVAAELAMRAHVARTRGELSGDHVSDEIKDAKQTGGTGCGRR